MKNPTDERAASYVALLNGYLLSKCDVTSLRAEYLERFTAETSMFPQEIYEVLNGAFSDLNTFTTDPFLLRESPETFLDEIQLRDSLAGRVSALGRLLCDA